jgi:biotin carboxyl carrier protein
MVKVLINANHAYTVEGRPEEFIVNKQAVEIDLLPVDSRRIHVIKDQVSYMAEIVSFNHAEKSGILKINSNSYSFSIKDQYDELLQKLGINVLQGNMISELKAPMPGLVLKILTSEGQEVKKGDNLLILEAMKMENIIKSPVDTIIGAVKIKEGDKVEKNQVLIKFDNKTFQKCLAS